MNPSLYMQTGNCFLCGDSTARCQLATVPMWFECLRCGMFGLTAEAAHEINGHEDVKPYLSAATRQASERQKRIVLRTDNYATFVEEHRWTTVQEKCRKILEYIKSKTSFYSQIVSFNPTIYYPLFDATSPEECKALTEELYRKALINHGANNDPSDWTLTMEGWDKLEPLQSGGIPGRCFIAMAFDRELDQAYHSGRAALRRPQFLSVLYCSWDALSQR